MQNNTKITNGFQLGLLGGLGVLTALVLGGAIATIAHIITYVAAAIFIALGLDPVVTFLERKGLKRPIAIVTVIVIFFGIVGTLIWSLAPTLVRQTTHFIQQAPELLAGVRDLPWMLKLDSQFNGAISTAINNAGTFLADSANWPKLLGGVVQVSLQIFNGFFAGLVIVILSIYFMASLTTFKNWIYSLVPASRRSRFSGLGEQIAQSIGRYVMGQVSIATINGTLGFIFMSIIGVPFALVLAFITFLLALIPLVGSITGAMIVVIVALTVSPVTALIAAIYYAIYMQLEAYFISPRIMNRAVAIPGAVVVVAALAGGALLGILGALVAIPVAASIILVLRQVWVPAQNER